jgi:hypothetical protein
VDHLGIVNIARPQHQDGWLMGIMQQSKQRCFVAKLIIKQPLLDVKKENE